MRQPPPLNARLGLYRHGDTVSERAALELVSRPDFVEGGGLRKLISNAK